MSHNNTFRVNKLPTAYYNFRVQSIHYTYLDDIVWLRFYLLIKGTCYALNIVEAATATMLLLESLCCFFSWTVLFAGNFNAWNLSQFHNLGLITQWIIRKHAKWQESKIWKFAVFRSSIILVLTWRLADNLIRLTKPSIIADKRYFCLSDKL